MNVLVVSHNPLSMQTNNGKTMIAYLNNLDPSNIYQIYLNQLECSNVYKDRTFCIREDVFFMKKIFQRNNTEIYKRKATQKEERTKIREFVSQLVVLRVLRSFLWRRKKLQIIEKVLDSISNWEIDIVLLAASNIPEYMSLGLEIAKYKKVPMVLAIGDNYLYADKKWKMIKNLLTKRLEKIYKKCFSYSFGIIAISEAMAIFLHKQYKIDNFIIAMNAFSIDSKDIKEINYRKDNKKELTFLYTGNLGLGRSDSIVHLLKAIQILNSSGYKIFLKIFSYSNESIKLKKQLQLGGGDFCGALSSDKLEKERKHADVMIHIESFKSQYRGILETAFSTKIPEYLSAMKPIICIGPIYSAVIQYLEEKKTGCAITSKTDKVIADSIDKFLSDANTINEDIANGFREFEEKFNAKINGERIYTLFLDAIIDYRRNRK